MLSFSRAASRRDRGRLLFVPPLLLAISLFALQKPAIGGLAEDTKLDAGIAAERYALPITPPLDQGDSDLCWVFAALSMLETNYMVRHPGSKIALSRGALQVDSIADRFRRRLRGESVRLEEGGLAVEAIALIRQNGLFDRSDFHDVVDSDPIFPAIEAKVAPYENRASKQKALDEELRANLGAPPKMTHLEGKAASPVQLARAMLGDEEWTEFDLSRDGVEGWGPSHDPDARPETRVRYVGLDVMIDLIHRSLARGEAVVWGTVDHALLIYGADYDGNGKPLSYLIKDSLPPYTYRASAETIHATLNDVTVTTQPDSIARTSYKHPSAGASPKP
ncbi:MAG: hypothetical protein WAK41_24000 [Roseiarcus sp.]